jgi:sarcosine oxidase, subunit beta
MSSRDDRIVVVGAGAAGLSTALHLAEMGFGRVVVLEQRHVAAGSSALSVGMFTRAYLDRLNIEMRVWALNYVDRFVQAGELTLLRNGYLRLARDAAGLAQLEAAARLERDLSVPDAQVLSPAEITAIVPDLRVDELAGALWLPTDGYLDGAALCGVYLEQATQRGVRYVGHARVNSVTRRGSTVQLHTTRGLFEADAVVNAAGAWANQVAALLGSSLPVVPQRHQAAVLQLREPPDYIMPNVMDYVPGGSRPRGVYFRYENARQLVAGVHTNEVEDTGADDPEDFRHGIDGRFQEELGSMILELLPGLDDIGVSSGWAGLYPMSPDGWPILGATDDPSVFVCAGLGGVGINLSPVAGRLVAETIAFGEFRAIDDAAEISARRLFAGV